MNTNQTDAAAMHRRLEIFLTIIKKGSFSGTAEALNMSQPNVSYHLRKLEQALGTKLMHREGYHEGGEITEAGKIVAAHAASIINELNSMKACLRAIQP
jgi:DNA-binding transcriptional LysR family regulator